jgi:hypothetical protein
METCAMEPPPRKISFYSNQLRIDGVMVDSSLGWNRLNQIFTNSGVANYLATLAWIESADYALSNAPKINEIR